MKLGQLIQVLTKYQTVLGNDYPIQIQVYDGDGDYRFYTSCNIIPIIDQDKQIQGFRFLVE